MRPGATSGTNAEVTTCRFAAQGACGQIQGDLMSGVKRTSEARGRKKAAVTALGLAGALSLAGGAAASTVPNGGVPALKAAPVMLADEEISDVSLATFYVFDKDNIAPAGIKLAARGGCGHGCGGHGCGHGCGGRGCAAHGCRGCGHGGCRGCGVGGCGGCVGGCGGCGGGCCIWVGPVRVC